MTASNIEPGKVWEILWESLDGGVRNLPALKAGAREEAHFTDDMGLDSLDLLEFYLRLDEAFGLDLTAEDYPALTSVHAIVALLEARAASA